MARRGGFRIHTTIRYNKIPRLTPELRKSLSAVVRRAAFALEGHMKTAMSEPKSGRFYLRGTRLHRASAPGEAPAVDYGQLKNSIGTEFAPRGLTALVGTNDMKAAFLEYGTYRMAPRPFFVPAVDAIEPIFRADCARAVRGLGVA